MLSKMFVLLIIQNVEYELSNSGDICAVRIFVFWNTTSAVSFLWFWWIQCHVGWSDDCGIL